MEQLKREARWLWPNKTSLIHESLVRSPGTSVVRYLALGKGFRIPFAFQRRTISRVLILKRLDDL